MGKRYQPGNGGYVYFDRRPNEMNRRMPGLFPAYQYANPTIAAPAISTTKSYPRALGRECLKGSEQGRRTLPSPVSRRETAGR